MGLFQTSSPFDADVEKATSEKNISIEWGKMLDICDKVGTSTQNAKDCLRSIVKRLYSPDPHIVMQALTLLDVCVINCGKTFHLEIASRDFENDLRKLVNHSEPKIAEKMKELLKKMG
uniref:Signal transducing adapter molecule 1 n=1 Tax=Apis cerana TaxID=7461 RepID=V9IHR1_APICE